MTPTDEQVERVARAIYEAGIPKGGKYYVAWDDLESEGFYVQHDLAMKQARAAIAALQPQVSPELIEKLGKLATYLTEQGEYEACDLIDTVVERVTKPALPPQGDGWQDIASGLAKALRRLAYHAQTSGGTAGRDEGLVAAVEIGLAALREYDTAKHEAPPAAEIERAPKQDGLAELRVGDFVLRHAANGIWIGRTDGEGGEFATEHVERVIAQFYREQF